MGGKSSKSESTSTISAVVIKPPELTETDYAFLVSQTGQSKESIKKIFDKFMSNNPDFKLDKKEFVKLYSELRSEPYERLDEISTLIFKAFDTDHNNYISFNEFMVAYALTSRGDVKDKLDYAFNLYDQDRNGFLTSSEIRTVLGGMFDLLGASSKNYSVKELTEQCLQELDTSKDGKVSKEEFITGLLKSYSLRALMSPFN